MCNRALQYIFMFCVAVAACGCPAQDSAGNDGAENGSGSSAGTAPIGPIPAGSPFIVWAGLRLGMSSFELSQVYNAPEGVGEGFTRVIESYDAVAHHIIQFDPKVGEPARRIVASFYRDELYIIVDRRDGLDAGQAAVWFDECVALYGGEYRETVAGAQWSWEGKDGVLVAFTQDNASEKHMNANLVLAHQPTQTAAHEYLEEWTESHPGIE